MAPTLRHTLASARHRAVTETKALGILREAGLLKPRQLGALMRAERQWKGVMAAGYAAWADLTPDRVALIDETGRLTFLEVHERSNAVVHGLRDSGINEGDTVAVLCRNHRGFVDVTVAVAKLGAHIVLLNTGFAGPQLGEVVAREGCKAIIYDGEYRDMVEQYVDPTCMRILSEEEADQSLASVGSFLQRFERTDPPVPKRAGRMVILTSGTTGTPKGANRPTPRPIPSSGAVIFSRIPYRTRQTFVIAAPMFHAWGLGQMLVAQNTGGCVVLRRRFDPEETLSQIDEHRAECLGAVPVMLQRILALDPALTDRYDVSSLSIVASSGSALPGSLATEWMDRFGDNLYNFYGSTEVAQAAVATPEDMRAAPGTAGKPPLGTVLKLLDDDGREVVGVGNVGRIFVGSDLSFDGYTGGGGKEVIDGLMSTGDLGWFDADGRLFVGGRDDDMIVSGGENVFPREVQDLLADHPGVADVAVVGVPDETFGQRLCGFVVLADSMGETHVDEATLLTHVKANLAGYKVPREIRFVDEIPRNATGKILSRVLQSDA